uniref:endo-1,3(4)-beta-glucanase n=1 Tax=Paecilomyces sp. 'thermophila' TaxID=566408 RepID=A0A1Z1G6S7_9EURO|nr:GH family 16 beta-1,3-glucosyltransferase [Paecilomyces sp. 'thermophila']
MRSSLLSLGTAALVPSLAAAQSYTLKDSLSGKDFLDAFSFFADRDPTNGFVHYVSREVAEGEGLVKVTSSGSVYLGVDHTNTLSLTDIGRKSVRLESTDKIDHGLVIADIKHMPGSICGAWPAFWTVGDTWPDDGEIDIIEGVNTQSQNTMVLHTKGNCEITSDDDQTGTTTSNQCSLDAGPAGCVVQGTPGSYGSSFNEQGGGVYAMQWTDEFIKLWFFPRSAIPKSIESDSPDVSEFGTPMGNFKGTCDIGKEFKPQKLVFDTTFCGDWAGSVYGQSDSCPLTKEDSLASCIDFVATKPEEFKEAYWEINYLKTYTEGPAESAQTMSSSNAKPAPSASSAVASKSSTTTATFSQDHSVTSSSQNNPATPAPSDQDSVGTQSSHGNPATQTSQDNAAPTSGQDNSWSNGSTGPNRSPASSSKSCDSTSTVTHVATVTTPNAPADTPATESEVEIVETTTTTSTVMKTVTVCPSSSAPENPPPAETAANPPADNSSPAAPPVPEQTTPATTVSTAAPPAEQTEVNPPQPTPPPAEEPAAPASGADANTWDLTAASTSMTAAPLFTGAASQLSPVRSGVLGVIPALVALLA